MGWFLVNILAPLLLPVLGSLPLLLVPIGPPGQIRVMATVKDGQLCWAVVAMSAAAMYDLWMGLMSHKNIPVWSGGLMVGVACLMLPAVVVAACGAVFSTPLLISPSTKGVVAWVKHYRAFAASVAMSLVHLAGSGDPVGA